MLRALRIVGGRLGTDKQATWLQLGTERQQTVYLPTFLQIQTREIVHVIGFSDVIKKAYDPLRT